MANLKADYRDYIVFILAGNYEQAENYARVHLHDKQGYTYLEDPTHIKGLKGIHYVRVGSWPHRPDLADLAHEFDLMGAIDITSELPRF